MDNNRKTIVIHTRVPKRVEQQLHKLVEEGFYSNVSDALRDAARMLIAKYDVHMERIQTIEKPKIELKHFKFDKKPDKKNDNKKTTGAKADK